MEILLIKPKKISRMPFPKDDMNIFTINDYDQNHNLKELISIEKRNNSWILLSNNNCSVEINGNLLSQVVLSINTFYYLKIKENGLDYYALLYIQKINDSSFSKYER